MTDEDLFNTDPEYSRQIKMSSSQYLLSTHRQVFFNPALDIIPNEALVIHLKGVSNPIFFYCENVI